MKKLRNNSNMTLAIPDDDDYVFCDECNLEYMGDCPQHQGFNIVSDTTVPSSCKKGIDEKYCWMTLPEGLVIKQSEIPNAGLGVFATQHFPKRTRFGPYVGKLKGNVKTSQESGYSWQIYKYGRPAHIIDGNDPSDSNWMRFINCARFEEEQCVTAYQHKGEIYYRSHRDIYPGTEILVYYGDSYAKELGIQLQYLEKKQKPIPKSYVKSKGIVHCHFCPLTFPSVYSYVETHLKYKHAEHFWREHSGIDNVMSKIKETVHTEYEKETGDSYNNCSENLQIPNGSREQCEKSSGVRLSTVRVLINTAEIEKLQCDICKKFYSSKDNLTTHRLKHTVKEHGLCNICSHKICKHMSEKSYACNECTFRTACLKSLIRHKTIHKGVKPYACDVCSFRSAYLRSFKIHKRSHTGERSYMCDLCTYKTTCLSYLKRHMDKHSGEKPYACDLCNFRTAYPNYLNRHKDNHTGKKPYACDLCNFRTAYPNNLKRHNDNHTGEKPYACDLCNFRTAYPDHLKSHKLKHSGEKPYACNVCKFKTAYLKCLNRHKRNHTGEKPYACVICSYRTAHPDHLKSHKLKHSGEKPYACNVCKFKTAYLKCLNRHKRNHTGEKPYACDLCSYRTAHPDHLKSHKLKHSGEKPYACNVCKFRTAYLKCLNRHKRKHTGEKPYACNLCSYKSLDLAQLKSHKYKHTEHTGKEHSGLHNAQSKLKEIVYTEDKRETVHTEVEKETVHTEVEKENSHSNCFETSQITNGSRKDFGVMFNVKVLINTSEIEKLQCDICNKYYVNKDCLTTHKSKHTREQN